MTIKKRYLPFGAWVLLAGMVFLLAQIVVMVLKAHSLTGVWVAYSLDDTYIHLSVAKNLALHGIWGMTPYAPTFCLSSPLYTFLLGVMIWVAGPADWLPLLLNLGAAFGVIWQVSRLFGLHGLINPVHKWVVFAAVFLVILATPLASLVLMGMEHTLHLFLVLVFLSGAIQILQGSLGRPNGWWLVCLPLLMLTRYESVFLLLPFLSILCIKKKYKYVLLFGFLAFVPMCVYGLVSVYNGWYFWPSSVLLKNKLAEHRSDFWLILTSSLRNLWNYVPGLIGFLIFSVVVCWHEQKRLNALFYMSFLLVVAGLSQVFLAKVGEYRYECWLMGSFSVVGICFLASLINQYGYKNKKTLGYGLVWGAACVFAGFGSYKYALHYPRSATNIYQQQFQMGRFIHQYYGGHSVALNDIGAACWLADFQLLDIAGLATKQVSDFTLANKFDSTVLKNMFISHNVSLIIAYPKWFVKEKSILAHPVASWQIPLNLICGSDIVWFYAPSISQKKVIKAQLKAFEKQLPKPIVVDYFDE